MDVISSCSHQPPTPARRFKTNYPPSWASLRFARAPNVTLSEGEETPTQREGNGGNRADTQPCNLFTDCPPIAKGTTVHAARNTAHLPPQRNFIQHKVPLPVTRCKAWGMQTRYTRLIRSVTTPAEDAEMVEVDKLATALEAHIEAHEERINRVHIFRAQSSALEEVIAELLDDLSFQRQVILTPQDGFVTRARPDFVHMLTPGRGIIAEVERGGTTTNNHDIKDLWKTHIALDAQHLFLIVPMANIKENGGIRERPYPRVVSRLSAFFGDPRREIDVLSAHIFGYGTSIALGSPVS